MKSFISLMLVFTLFGCDQNASENKYEKDKKILIALQPLNNFDKPTLVFLSNEIKNFYDCRVTILSQKNILPEFFDNTKSPRYSADSLLKYLKAEAKDSIDYVLGITHKDIFTTKKNADGNIKQPVEKYKIWGVMGLGSMPAKSCLVSDFRLHCNNKESEQRRLRNVTLHELGHNFGLDHCPDKLCIMTDANESIKTIDNESNTLCDNCRKKINYKLSSNKFIVYLLTPENISQRIESEICLLITGVQGSDTRDDAILYKSPPKKI